MFAPRHLLLSLLALAGCRKAAALEPVAVQRMAEHLTSKHREVFSESMGTEVVWSDRALLERTGKPPAPIQALLDAASERLVDEGAMGRLLQDLERRKDEWRPATVLRGGTGDFDCTIGDESTSEEVNCIYVNYLEARYPSGAFRVKGPQEVLVFMEGPQVRGALMPVKR